MKNFLKNKKFLSFKDMTRKDYGRNAIIGLLGGYVLNLAGNSGIYVIVGVIGDIVALLGFICGIIWVYKIVTKS